jgi:hypothetical protein
MRLRTSLLSLIALASSASAQTVCAPRIRQIVYIPVNGMYATKCRISPDGQSVVYLAQTRDNTVRQLRVSPPTFNNPQTIHNFPTNWNGRVSFFFDLSGQNLYFAAENSSSSQPDTGSVRRVGIANGTMQGAVTTLTSTTGTSNFRVIGMDNPPSLIFGVYRQTFSGQDLIFSVPDTGGLHTFVYWLAATQDLELYDVAPPPRRLLCSETLRATPVVFQYFNIDRNGQNRFNVGPAITQTAIQARTAFWHAPGSAQDMVTHITGQQGRDQVTMHSFSFPSYQLTEGTENRRVASYGTWWTPFMKEVSATQWEPAMVRGFGGGEIELASGTQQFADPPLSDLQISMDANRDRVAWVFSGACYTTRLDREVGLYNRANIGTSVTIELPMVSGESGACFVASGLASSGVPYPPLCGTFDLDGSAVTAFTGANQTTFSNMFIPNNPAYIGVTLYWQAARVVGTTSGDFTRVTRMRVF